MKTSSYVLLETRTFYAQTNMLLRDFRYCTNDVKCTLFKSFCANMYCCPLWFNSTSSTIKKLKTSYHSALLNLLLIKKPYSASILFVVLFCSLFTNYYALAFIGLQIVSEKFKLYYNGMHDSYCLYSFSHSAMVEISIILICTILLCDILLLLLLLLLYLYMFNNFLYVYGSCVCNKDMLLLL